MRPPHHHHTSSSQLRPHQHQSLNTSYVASPLAALIYGVCCLDTTRSDRRYRLPGRVMTCSFCQKTSGRRNQLVLLVHHIEQHTQKQNLHTTARGDFFRAWISSRAPSLCCPAILKLAASAEFNPARGITSFYPDYLMSDSLCILRVLCKRTIDRIFAL